MYGNTNNTGSQYYGDKAGLFTPKSDNVPCSYSGKLECSNGNNYYLSMYICQTTGNRAVAVLVFSDTRTKETHVSPLYKPRKPDSKVALTGKVTLNNDYRVLIYKNESENPKAPVLNMTLLPDDGAGKEVPKGDTEGLF